MYTFHTPSGLITVDNSCTVARLLSLGAQPASWEDICAASRGESSDDYLMRLARKSAEEISMRVSPLSQAESSQTARHPRLAGRTF